MKTVKIIGFMMIAACMFQACKKDDNDMAKEIKRLIPNKEKRLSPKPITGGKQPFTAKQTWFKTAHTAQRTN